MNPCKYPQCGKKRVKGKRVCAEHLAKLQENSKKARAVVEAHRAEQRVRDGSGRKAD